MGFHVSDNSHAFRIIFISISSILLAYCLFFLIFGADYTTDVRFAVMIDAGSSGSRIRVFRWIGSASSLESLNLSDDPNCIDVSPGISSFSNEPEKSIEVLLPLLKCANNNIPSNLITSTPIYLKATAGVRKLDPTIQTILLDKISNIICSNTKFICKRDQFSVISGSEEGLFLWISINHVLKNFQHLIPKEYSTVGVLDMGGASTQIAATTNSKENSDDIHEVSINGYIKNVTVFSKSILGGGMRDAHNKLLLKLLDIENLAEKIDDGDGLLFYDPCSYDGFQVILSVSDFIDVSKITSEELFRIFEGIETVQIEGKSNPKLCKKSCDEIVSLIASCEGDNFPQNSIENPKFSTMLGRSHRKIDLRWKNCVYGGEKLPPLTTKQFFSVSNFFYTTRFFEFGETVSLDEFFSHANTLCEMKWDEVTKIVDSYHNSFPVDELCFKSIYLYSFLQYGLGFNPKDHTSLHFVDFLNNNPTDWCIGAILVELSQNKQFDDIDHAQITKNQLIWIIFVSFVLNIFTIILLSDSLFSFFLPNSKLKSSPKRKRRQTDLEYF